jgi:hypothetical protein
MFFTNNQNLRKRGAGKTDREQSGERERETGGCDVFFWKELYTDP